MGRLRKRYSYGPQGSHWAPMTRGSLWTAPSKSPPGQRLWDLLNLGCKVWLSGVSSQKTKENHPVEWNAVLPTSQISCKEGIGIVFLIRHDAAVFLTRSVAYSSRFAMGSDFLKQENAFGQTLLAGWRPGGWRIWFGPHTCFEVVVSMGCSLMLENWDVPYKTPSVRGLLKTRSVWRPWVHSALRGPPSSPPCALVSVPRPP